MNRPSMFRALLLAAPVVLANGALAETLKGTDTVVAEVQKRDCRLGLVDYQASPIPDLSKDEFHAVLNALVTDGKAHWDLTDFVLDRSICDKGITASETETAKAEAEMAAGRKEMEDLLARGAAERSSGAAANPLAGLELPGFDVEKFGKAEGSDEFMAACTDAAARLAALEPVLAGLAAGEDVDIDPLMDDKLQMQMGVVEFQGARYTKRFLKTANISEDLLGLMLSCVMGGDECKIAVEDLSFDPKTVGPDLEAACKRDHAGEK